MAKGKPEERPGRRGQGEPGRRRGRRAHGSSSEEAAKVNGIATATLPKSASRAVEACFERNARNGVVLDLRAISNATDWFVIVSGDSDTHVRAIAEHVLDSLGEEGMRPAGVEGLSAGRWVLIDYIDAVIHVFHPTAREFYSLERLWGDAPTWTLEDPAEEL